MQAVNKASPDERKMAKLQAVRTREQNAEYEVEAVTGERGVISLGNKRIPSEMEGLQRGELETTIIIRQEHQATASVQSR